jgi:hypothetical protein
VTAPAVGLGTLRRLSELETAGTALSVYFDADCAARWSATEREHFLDGLLGELAPLAALSEQRSIHQMSRSLPALAYGTRSLALFSCAEARTEAVVPLPCTITPMAVIDTAFWLEPIAGMFSSGDLGVAVDGGTVRLFRGSRRVQVEFATLCSEIDLPASRSRRVAPHPCLSAIAAAPAPRIERAAALLVRAQQRRAFDELVLVTRDEICSAYLEKMLPSDLCARISEHVELALGDAGASEVTRAIAEHAHRASARWEASPSQHNHNRQARSIAHV